MKVLQKFPFATSQITEEICTRVITLFKYWYRSAQKKDFKEVKKTRCVPLYYATGDHLLCNVAWCYALQALEKGTSYNEPVTNFIPEIHGIEIEQVRRIIDKYTTDERIREMLHELDTQIYEAVNNALTFLAPKNKNFAQTNSLEYRIGHVISMHNDSQLE